MLNSDSDSEERNAIRDDLKTMSFEEIMKLKEELGTKVYNEEILGVSDKKKKPSKSSLDLKRLNKNRPREQTTKWQVPLIGSEFRNKKTTEDHIRDPRFDERTGDYDAKNFKDNYKFLSKIRQKEVIELKKSLNATSDEQERAQIKNSMQRLLNMNTEERNFHMKNAVLKEEKLEIQKAHAEGRKPHYATKKERKAKELVTQFEMLKKTGKLNKHLEKRRKKNAAKDRKKLSFD